MIQNKTARRIMYDWHGGQSSAFYAAASSGLVSSFVSLAMECDSITNAAERGALLCWIQRRQTGAPSVYINGQWFAVLPWVSRTLHHENAYFIIDDVLTGQAREGFIVMHGDPKTAVGTTQGEFLTLRDAKAFAKRHAVHGEAIFRVRLARRHGSHVVTAIKA